MPEKFEGDPPFLAVAVEGCGVLIDAHDQANAVLEILVDEGDAVADTEVGAAGDLRWGTWPVGFTLAGVGPLSVGAADASVRIAA